MKFLKTTYWVWKLRYYKKKYHDCLSFLSDTDRLVGIEKNYHLHIFKTNNDFGW